MITVFKNTLDVKPWFNKEVDEVLDAIKGNSKHIKDVLELRNNAKTYDSDKKSKIPCVTWSGTFNYRNTHGLVSLSNHIYLDIDNSDPKIVKKMLERDWLKAIWSSVSNWGLGLLVEVEGLTVTNYKSTYKALFDNLKEEGYNMDWRPDISRLNILSYDPEIKIFDSIKFKAVEPEPFVQKVFPPMENINEYCDIAFAYTKKKGLDFVKGQRHNFMVSVFGVMNQLGVPFDTSVEYANSKGWLVDRHAYKQAEDIYSRYYNEFGSKQKNEI